MMTDVVFTPQSVRRDLLRLASQIKDLQEQAKRDHAELKCLRQRVEQLEGGKSWGFSVS